MMKMKRSFVALLICVACSGDGSIGEVNVNRASAQPSTARDGELTLDQARGLLEQRTAQSVGSIALNGYNFHRELGIGRQLHVIAISRNLGGGLLLFNEDGRNIAKQETGEVTQLQLFDINEDGVAEIVTEEVDGRGTGVLEKSFRVYEASSSGFRKLWEGESYVRHANESKVDESIAFIRFDPSGSGRGPRLTHLLKVSGGATRETMFEWRNGALTKLG
jgi:hypothetical protein